MNIIDFERKGNAIRFYLGDNGTQWGDDWNDIPYEHNAESVYDEFVLGSFDICVPFDCNVYEPADMAYRGNSRYSKEDMLRRTVACVVIIHRDDDRDDEFEALQSNTKAVAIYFGDTEEDVRSRVAALLDGKGISRAW